MVSTNDLERAIRSGKPELIQLAKQYLELSEGRSAAQSFRQFVQLFWPFVSTTPLKPGFYLDSICDHLQHITQIRRLIINIPPRHGKSTLVSVLFPAWYWISQPSTKFIVASYSLKELSTRDSIACRTVIESPLYQQHWGHKYKMSSDQNTKTRFGNDKLGFRLATSTEAAVLGEGADIFVCDDLNNVAKIHSDADRLSVINFWCSVLSTRMNPGGLDCKIVIQQRCHEQDITGYIINNDAQGDWTRLVLPWHYEPERQSRTPIWYDPRTIPGEPLSDLYSEQQIQERKGGNGLGPTGFATQFQQRPAPVEGAMFQRDWFRTYHATDTSYLLDGQEVRKEHCHTFITTDLAISLRTTADWTVAQVWCITPHNHLLLVDQYRARVETPEAIKEFERLCKQYHADHIHVEDVAFQRTYIRLLKDKGLPVRAFSPNGMGDKKARAQRSLVKAECRQIWIPSEAPWLTDWMSEVVQFPNAAHDDMVDCCSMAGHVARSYPTRELPHPEVMTKEDRIRRREAEIMGG